jgi:hypothetical protein
MVATGNGRPLAPITPADRATASAGVPANRPLGSMSFDLLADGYFGADAHLSPRMYRLPPGTLLSTEGPLARTQ